MTEFCKEDTGDIKVLCLPGSCRGYLSIDDACDVKLFRINFQGTRVFSPFPKPAATWRHPLGQTHTHTGRRALVSSPHLVSWWVWEKGLMRVGTWSAPFLLRGLVTAGGTLWSVSLCGVFFKPSTGARCLRPRVSLLDTECIVVGEVGH